MIAVLNVALDAKVTTLITPINAAHLDTKEVQTLYEEFRYIIRETERLTQLQKLPTDGEFKYCGEDSARLLDRIGDALVSADLKLIRIKAVDWALRQARQETVRRLQTRFG
jgi:hypothetical protein